MKYFELEIEHSYQGKFITRHRLKGRGQTYVLGQNKNSDIRLLGAEVGGVHAYVEWTGDKWSLTDAGSEFGTWLGKNQIDNIEINNELSLTLGGHSLKFYPRAYEREVFKVSGLAQKTTTGTKKYHQVIIKQNDHVLKSELIPVHSSYSYVSGSHSHVLSPPTTDEIKETVFGSQTVIQRLVYADQMHIKWNHIFQSMNSDEMRSPLKAILSLLVLVFALVALVKQIPSNTLDELKPENKYTKMVFDADLMKKKRAEAREMQKMVLASAPKAVQIKNTLTTPVKSKGHTPKVISKLKMDGLSAMLGKIAKRATQNGPKIQGFGQTAESKGTGGVQTVAAVGSLQGIATGAAGNGGSTYKVGGVGTFGKGGGNTRGLAGVGGLAAAGAGSGTVGILDEETEIDGGLDKEVIAAVIAKHIGEIRYCYERQLSAEPDIYGKVQVKFTINANGSVETQRIGSSTLKSAMVEGCILRRLASWSFPKPKGGTQVLVTYPFMFKSTQ